MKKLLLVSTALIALASPAHATLQVFFSDGLGGTFACANGGGCDFSPTPNLLTFNNVVGNFAIDGTLSVSQKGGVNVLTLSNFGVTNTGLTTGTLHMFVSDTGFVGPASKFSEAASINFLNNVGAGASSFTFFVDQGNNQGAPGTPGTAVFTTSDTPTTSPDSFSGKASQGFSVTGLYSMTEQIDLNLISQGSVTGFNVGIQAGIPELGTWGMMICGFLGIGLLGMAKRRDGRGFRLA